jgi:hypothetical protein
MNKRLTQMNDRLKESKQTLNEDKEGMRKSNKVWRLNPLNLKQGFIRLCPN